MKSDAARAQLARWGLDDVTAEAAGLFDVESAAAVYAGMPALPAIVIPYWEPDGTVKRYVNGAGPAPFARLRLLAERPSGGWQRKALRYLQPGHSGVHVYLPPLVDWKAVAADPSIPVIITEGEAKALAACRHGFTCLALGGVYNFTTPGGRLLPDIEALCHLNRQWYIIFDSDASTNPNVVAAEARLVQMLQLDRGMRCHIVRLPGAGEEKTGLDDYLRVHGPEALELLLTKSRALSPLDARIMAMNRRYAWIDRENMVYNLETRMFIRKEAFTSGSLASSETFAVPYKDGMKEIPLAPRWLNHIHAQRFSEALFRPGEPERLQGDHGAALNMWRGFAHHEPGDVGPWLRLTEYLFSLVQSEHQDLPLKLMAYKAQNPATKTAIATVIIGDQGTGKSVWADCLADAFAPASAVISPETLGAQFQEWMEQTLLATCHEITPDEIQDYGEKIKALISEKRRMMNAKFRPAREILNFTQFIITANHRGVGAYAADDRRMFVVDTPDVGDPSLYDDVWAWRENGGGKYLLHYLLHYPLGDWKPPQRAPQTAGKLIASAESRTPVQQLAIDMRRGDAHMILQFWDMAVQWAAANETSNDSAIIAHCRAIMAAAPDFPIRPWYTGAELALLLPWALEITRRGGLRKGTPGGDISRQLRDAGIRYLINRDDPEGFTWQGQTRQYLVVAEPDDWKKPISQADFERAMANWPTYKQLRGRRK